MAPLKTARRRQRAQTPLQNYLRNTHPAPQSATPIGEIKLSLWEKIFSGGKCHSEKAAARGSEGLSRTHRLPSHGPYGKKTIAHDHQAQGLYVTPRTEDKTPEPCGQTAARPLAGCQPREQPEGTSRTRPQMVDPPMMQVSACVSPASVESCLV